MKVIKTAVFAFCLAVFTQGATVPVQNMSLFSLGAEYYGSLNGHPAMYNFDSTALGAHILRLHYAPIPFFRLSAGVGGSHQTGDNLKGVKAGVSGTVGAALYTPKLANFLSVTAGYDWFYLKAKLDDRKFLTAPIINEDGEITDEFFAFEALTLKDKSTAQMHVPYAGLIIHLGKYADLEAGGQYRIFDLDRKRTVLERDQNYKVTNEDFRDTSELSKQIRIYGNLTLHERESGAYVSGGVSYAPIKDDDFKDKNLWVKFSAHAQIGIIMRDPRGSSKKDKGEYSDAYIELKARQDSMAEALSRDIERDKERNREEGRDENDFSEDEE